MSATGQYVEVYPTIPSSRGTSLGSGTRAIVQSWATAGEIVISDRAAMTSGSRAAFV